MRWARRSRQRRRMVATLKWAGAAVKCRRVQDHEAIADHDIRAEAAHANATMRGHHVGGNCTGLKPTHPYAAYWVYWRPLD